jgi:peptidyl-prolyl cis-trans isomerase SurA
MPVSFWPKRGVFRGIAMAALLAACSAGGAHAQGQARIQTPPGTAVARIVAVAGGDVITEADVENRTLLFAVSTGMPTTPDVLARLRTQIANQLIDERLRLQEAQRRKIVIGDKQIAAAIHDIETRNNLPDGGLRDKLAAQGISIRTLIDQVRAQMAWTQVMREVVADKLNIPDAELDEQLRLHDKQIGKPEYRVGEIFIPVDDPVNTADARRFAETVIGELRAGTPFSVVAAQFSQTQTALEGGELGWVQPDQLDPEVGRLVTEMPVGAVSNPVKVPGGFSVVSLQAKREIGHDMSTFLTIRQVFLPFSSPLDPREPTQQQRDVLESARSISANTKGCAQMDQIAKNNPSNRPTDPGEIRLDTVNPPQFRELLTNLPIGQASQPLVASDGIAVVTVCSREQKNTAVLTKEDIRRRLITERVDLAARQLLRDLRRRATIERFDGGA